MATTHATEHGHGAHAEAAHDEHAHPGNSQYVKIALYLAILTAIEVGLYYAEDLFPSWAIVTALIVLATGKFIMVAMYFMHLKFDSPMFTGFFAVGLVATVAAFLAVLAMQRALFV